MHVIISSSAMILWLIVLIVVQPALSSPEPCLDYVQSAMRYKLDLLITQENRHFHTIYNDKQYDITLQRLNCGFNRTVNQQRTLLSRSRRSGGFYLLVGNDIHRMVFDHMCFHWSYIATIEDSNDVVGEFEIEEILSSENKTYLIVALYLEDRFQIYQIPGAKVENSTTAIKSIQKIRRPGRSTKTFLLHHSSNVYLITGYMDSDSGKIAVYRWLNYHFSVEDVKEVSRHTELIVYSNKQIVILVLDSTETPDRSTSHIYVLNDQRKIVKTQEMYFLFNRMPHYVVDEDLYILRCLAIDKCFLYKWNGENLFLRVSKIGLNPKNIELIDNNESIIALSFRNELFFYRNQPLLKMASSYAVIEEHGSTIANHLSLGIATKRFFLYREPQTDHLYLFLVGDEDESIAEIFQLKLSIQQRASPTEGEQENFNALKTCLINIKTIVNIRKGWIDLMKYQMTKIVRACKSLSQSSLSTDTIFIANSNMVKKIAIDGVKKRSTSMSILHKWKSMKSAINDIYLRSKDLFYLNKVNAVQTDMKVRGNLHTKNIKMKSLKIHPSIINQRFKRKVQSVRSLTATTINVKDIIHEGNNFKGLVYKNRINRFPFLMSLKNVHAEKMILKTHAINMIQISSTLYNASDSIPSGLKQFRTIDSISGNVLQVNSNKGQYQLSVLRNVLASTENSAEIRLSGTRNVNSLIISEHLNYVLLNDLFSNIYYNDAESIISGNIYVRSMSQIRNIHGTLLNSIEIEKIFNLRTNQTITASIYMHKVYAKVLVNHHINRLSIPKDTILIGDTKLIKTALASNFVILNDLTLSTDERYVNNHVLGTKIEDFSQIYLGNVFLKGSLTLSKIIINNKRTQMLIKGQLANVAVGYHFWMKQLEQEIQIFGFHRHVACYQLLSRTLNYQTVSNYIRVQNWSILSQNFSKVHVRGKVELFIGLPSIVHYVNSEAVLRGTMSTISGKKIFVGTMYIEFLASEFIGFTNLHNFATEHASAIMLSGVKQVYHMEVRDCSVNAHEKFNIDRNQHIALSSVIDCSINIRDIQQSDHLFISDLEMDQMDTARINGKLSEMFILEVNNITSRVDPAAKHYKIENLISKLNVISINQVFVTNVNGISIADYARLLTLKGHSSVKHREIGGCKVLSKGVITVDGNFNGLQINDQNIHHLIHNAARKSIPQNVVGLWFTNDAEMKYLTAKQINGLTTRNLLNANLYGFKLRQTLMLESLRVHSNVNGHIVPNVSSITIPKSVRSIEKCLISGSFIVQNHLLGTHFYDVLYTTVTNERNAIEGKIVFHSEFIDMISVWNNGNIVGHSSNFQQILTDAVSSKQTLVIFHRAGRAVKHLVCQHTVSTENALTVLLINGIDILSLNRSIHTTLRHLELVSLPKSFLFPPKIAQFACSDQLNNIVYPHHLTHLVASKNKIKYSFDQYVNVLGDLHVNAINGYSVQHFLSDCVMKNLTTYKEYSDISQQVANFLTFSTLILSQTHHTLQTINQIPLNDVTNEVSSEHQMMSKPKQIEGQLTLLGPTSVIHCNEHMLLDNFKLSFWLQELQMVHDSIVFFSNEDLKSGVVIDNILNSVPITRMMKLRLSSVEDLLPLLPKIRGQLLLSSNGYRPNQIFETRTPHFETSSYQNISKTAENDDSSKVYITQTRVSRIDHVNVTVHDGITKSRSTLVPGRLIRAKYEKVLHNDKTHIVILTLIKQETQTALSIHVFLDYSFISHQNIAVSSSASFYLIKPSPTADIHSSVLLAVSESVPVQSGSMLSRLKLYYYEEIKMKFINFKTLSGKFNIIEAVTVDRIMMILVVEENSNVLTILSLEKQVNVLYQQIIFNEQIVSIEKIIFQGVSAIRVMTNDVMLYLYVYSSLEGWKQL